MKSLFYKACNNGMLLQVVTELGKDRIEISVGNKNNLKVLYDYKNRTKKK